MEKEMLKGKVAIITGASYGMGQTMAELFAEEGAAVVLTARGQEKLDQVVAGLRAKGGRAVGVVADVCSTEDTTRVFETALREFGNVDILINNAGIGEQKMIDETDDDWMLYVMNTNLGGPMRYIREALKIFLPKNDGVIINISSVNGERPFCGATYTSTKGALNILTKNVAMRLVDTNIRCNAVAPGATVTPPISPTKPANSLAVRRCWNTANIMFIFLDRNVTRWTRRMPACILPVRWAVMSKGR